MKIGDLAAWSKRSGVVMEIYQSGRGWGSGKAILMACLLSGGKMVRVPLSNLRKL